MPLPESGRGKIYAKNLDSCNAGGAGGFGDSLGNGGTDSGIEGLGDDVLLVQLIVGDQVSQSHGGGHLHLRASDINEEMKMAAAMALANLITDEELSEEYIIPKAFDPRVGPAVAKAVAEAARATGVARI